MLEQTNKTLAIYSERGKNGKRLERVYRQLFKQELYDLAYAEIYANPGATTKGSDGESLDGMSKERIDKIIEKSQERAIQMDASAKSVHPKKRWE